MSMFLWVIKMLQWEKTNVSEELTFMNWHYKSNKSKEWMTCMIGILKIFVTNLNHMCVIDVILMMAYELVESDLLWFIFFFNSFITKLFFSPLIIL